METNAASSKLEHIPADTRLVEDLYANGKISREARDYALSIVAPPRQWGVWISRILLALGVPLILSGIVFFFAYNWDNISSFGKFAIVQGGMIAFLAGAFYYKLDSLIGKLFLVSASVMVGIFWAVFGQVYQTGADSYLLFMMWAILISGWTLISRFSVQWILWLVIMNIFVVTWVQQTNQFFSIYTLANYLIPLNVTTLLARELFLWSGFRWLDEAWTRYVLLAGALVAMSWIVIHTIFNVHNLHVGIFVYSPTLFACWAGPIILAFVYHKFIPNIWAHAMCIISLCLMLEMFGIRAIFESHQRSGILNFDPVAFLLASLLTLAIITAASVYLRFVANSQSRRLAHA